MKIVIVENPRPLTMEHYNDVANAPLSASLNSGYALAAARRAGWDTSYLDFSSAVVDTAGMANVILAEEGDLILFHWVYSWGHEHLVCAILSLLRQSGSAPLGAFGLFPTLSRQRLMQYALQLDFILAGECEETITELLCSFRKKPTLEIMAGVALRDTAFVPRQLISDLARLPIPEDVGANCSYSSLNIAASRGCYGNCSFCFINRFYGCSRRRVRETAALERELEIRLTRSDIRSLYFIDPTFIGPGREEQERVTAVSLLAKRFALPFGFETRVDTVDKRLFSVLSENGATSVFLGIESGCDTVLQRLNKGITRRQIIEAVRIVRECQMKLSIGFIMFEPDATLEELHANYDFLEGLDLLRDHDLTANLLYHNQIVLSGSSAWMRHEREERLLYDERTPFEARYRFRDERVGRVCSAMGRMAMEYFRGMAEVRQSAAGSDSCCAQPVHDASSDNDINVLLKEAFLMFCTAAGDPAVHDREEIEALYRLKLKDLLAVRNARILAASAVISQPSHYIHATGVCNP